MSQNPTPRSSELWKRAREEANEAIYIGRANTVRALLLMAGVRRLTDLPEDQLETFRQALALAQRPRHAYADQPTLLRRVTTRKLTLRIM